MAKKTGSKKLVVVESPTKAKTIKKYLGDEFMIESCMGHIRDLPQSAKDIPEKVKKEPWAKLGVNVDKDFEPLYCIPKNKTKVVKTLKDLLKEADELILATDEDREGESISWHLLEVLKPKVPVKRMVFHEITKSAIQKALDEFREIDFNLVKAQETRRVLDRLVGYTLSPLIWKKVAYGLSAGRVQSVAVRLIAEREHARLRFVRSSYWGLNVQAEKDKAQFQARLIGTDSKKVATGKDFDGETGKLLDNKKSEVIHLDETKAKAILKSIEGKKLKVIEVEEKPVSRKPAPPFITSTLQQEANRKLGMGAREAMQVAQSLYERGLITYMRTDSTFLSKEALEAARGRIEAAYGKEYLPDAPRTYEKKKAKGAQEAHEAIRPAGTEMTPPEESKLRGPALKLYEMIWKRTIASQMVNSQQKQMSIRFDCEGHLFTASGMTIEFPGFLKVYVESTDDESTNDKEVRLPKMAKGDEINVIEAKATDHETKPPARFTEASLVQTLEKEGIGRPSTYAAIISTILNRGYVNKAGNALVPTFTAMIVSKLLSNYLPKYVDSEFTSKMENSLDDIAEGDLDYHQYLKEFYLGDEGLKSEVDSKEEVIDAEEARSIRFKPLGELEFRVGRYGAYVCRKEDGEDVCASLPFEQAPADITEEIANKLIDQKINGTDALGDHPESGQPIYVLNGRYGPYVQLGDASDEGDKPKRTSLPAGIEPEDVDMELAVFLLDLPKTLGQHPDTEKDVKVGIGRFGPYIVCDGDFRSIPKGDSLFTIDLKRSLEILSEPKKGRGKATPLKELGKHPDTDEDMNVMSGKYGPYVKCGKVNISLPDDLEPADVTKEKAIELLEPKMASKAKKKAKKKTGATAKKKTAKKATKKVTKKTAKKATKKKATKTKKKS